MFVGTSGYSGAAPFSFTYQFAFSDIGEVDKVEKLEVDFGEGDGYEDVTSTYLAWKNGTGAKPAHIFVTEGEYSINTRVTLETGEVFEQSNPPSNVTVLPPDDGDGA